MVNPLLLLVLLIALISFITLVLRFEFEMSKPVAMILAFSATGLGFMVAFVLQTTLGVSYFYSLGLLGALVFMFGGLFEVTS